MKETASKANPAHNPTIQRWFPIGAIGVTVIVLALVVYQLPTMHIPP